MIGCRFLGIMLCVVATPLHAELLPQPSGGDPRIQTVPYDAREVTLLRVAPGYALTLIFSPDERISTVTLGNSSDWQVDANRRADNLVIKAGQGAPRTNLTVLTDVRSYSFTLSASAPSADLPYVVSFRYPPPEFDVEPQVKADPGRYRLRGKKAIRPAAITDDGENTSIIWPPNVSLPAVYKIDANGNGALVNGLMRDDVYVVEGVYSKLVFKLGKSEASATRETEGRGGGG